MSLTTPVLLLLLLLLLTVAEPVILSASVVSLAWVGSLLALLVSSLVSLKTPQHNVIYTGNYINIASTLNVLTASFHVSCCCMSTNSDERHEADSCSCQRHPVSEQAQSVEMLTAPNTHLPQYWLTCFIADMIIKLQRSYNSFIIIIIVYPMHSWHWTDIKSFESLSVCLSICPSEVLIALDSDQSFCPIFLKFEM